MVDDFASRYRAIQSKDARFDGWFFTAVKSTGIYCRPSCPVRPPMAKNVVFYPTAAAAQLAGFRACKRCRPDAAPGSPEWNVRGDLVARAMRLIADGVVDRDGVPALASQLGYSERQIERSLSAEVGAGPLALARAQRAQTARILIETTLLPITEVAFAAGFSSIRQFNETIREVFALTPTELRAKANKLVSGIEQTNRNQPETTRASIQLRLPYRRPYNVEGIFGHLVATAVRGVENWTDGAYWRTLRLPHGAGVVGLRPEDGFVAASLELDDLRDLAAAVARCRWLLDLDADPVAADAALAEDPVLESTIRKAPGRRVTRTVDGHELTLRIVIGQQISTAAARTHTGRLVAQFGDPLPEPGRGLTHLFPSAARLADVTREELRMPESRHRTLTGIARALAAGTIDVQPGAERATTTGQLLDVAGIGPWSASLIAMRALGDPDAFPGTDLGVIVGGRALGLPEGKALQAHAERWRPWRAYATQYLWGATDHPINHLPGYPSAPTRSQNPLTRKTR